MAMNLGITLSLGSRKVAPVATGGTFTGVPAISGTRGGTLTGTNATYSGTDTLLGQWYLDNVATGDTDTSFTDSDTSKSVEYRNSLAISGETVSAYRGVEGAAHLYANDFKSATTGKPLADQMFNWATENSFINTPNGPGVSGWQAVPFLESTAHGEAIKTIGAAGGLYFSQTDSAKVYRSIGDTSHTLVFKSAMDDSADFRGDIFVGGAPYYNSYGSFGVPISYRVLSGAWDWIRINEGTSLVVAGERAAAIGDTITVDCDNVAGLTYVYLNGELLNPGGFNHTVLGNYSAGDKIGLGGGTTSGAVDLPFLQSLSVFPSRIPVISAVPEEGTTTAIQLKLGWNNRATGATNTQYRVDVVNGPMVQGWTTIGATGSGTTYCDVPNDIQGLELVVTPRSVGGSAPRGIPAYVTTPAISEQKMRISMNDSDWASYDGNTPTRDLAKSAGLTLQPIGLSSGYRSAVLGANEEVGEWGDWDHEYDPLKTYPYWTGLDFGNSDQKGWRCMYQGIQYETLSTVNGSVPLATPPDPAAVGPYWKPSGYALSNLIRDDATGLIYRHPVDTNRETQYELAELFPAGHFPFTINGACLDGYGNPVPNAILEFYLNGNMTLTSQNVAAGTFVITVTRDQVDAEGGSPRIIIKRSGPVVPQLQLLPSYESGTALHSAAHLADMSVFASTPRRMSVDGINQRITLYHKPRLAKRIKPVATGWRGEGCWEYEVGYAVAANKPLSINTSYFADAEYMEAQAVFVRDYPGFTQKSRVAHSNEDWQRGNPAFYQGELLAAEATAAGVTPFQMKARKHRQMMEIWHEVFAGQTERLIGSLEWQTFTSISAWEDALNFENCYQYVGEISTAPYHSGDVMRYGTASTTVKDAIAANDYAAFVTAMRSDMTAAIAVAVSGVKTLWDWLPNYNVSKGLHKDAIQINSYEANHHAEVSGEWPNLTRAITFWNDFKTSSNMSDMTTLYIDSMAASCPHHMFIFDYCGISGRTAARRLTDGSGWNLMKKTGNITDHPMSAVIERAAHYNAL